MTLQTHAYDVAIVGGGLVGMSFALMLAQQTSLSVIIIESKAPPESLTLNTYHHRVSAFSLSSVRLLINLGVWQAISKKRMGPFHRIEVADELDALLVFDSSDIAESNLGFIIENKMVEDELYTQLKSHPAVHFLHHARLKDFKETSDGVLLQTEDQQVIKSHLAIAADGANSWLRESASIEMDRGDYHQLAFVATVETEKPHDETARQLFLKSGPLAFLPLDQPHFSSIVWSLTIAEANRIQQLNDDDFARALAQAFRYRIGEVKRVSKRYSFPLSQQCTKQYIKSRVILMGDAAHTIHPLAGQGVNIGLLDAASLIDVMNAALKRLPVEKIFMCLDPYERWRKAENSVLLQGVHWLNALMMSQSSMLSYARSLGMKGVSRSNGLKNILMRYAVGDRLDLPLLARKHA